MMKRSIFLFSDGKLTRKDHSLCFESEKGKQHIPIQNISDIYVFGEVDFNKRLLGILSIQEIILHYFNYYGYYMGSFYPREHQNAGYMILKQAACYMDDQSRLELARLFIDGAVSNIQRVLKYYQNRDKPTTPAIETIEHLQTKIGTVKKVDQLMAIEGNIRDTYYQAFDGILQNEEFVFGQRTRRPPKNNLNTLISFGNSLLYTLCLSEIYKTYLDARIGFLHTTNFRRFSLNLDVAEIFKPVIVDHVIFTLINKGMIKGKDFVKQTEGLMMSEKSRKIFITEWEKKLKTTIKHKGIGRSVSYRRLIRLELYKLQKHLMGEKAYEPFVSRW